MSLGEISFKNAYIVHYKETTRRKQRGADDHRYDLLC